MNLLFVCSKNNWRSRTAETIFGKSPLHKVKSAGTDADARVLFTDNLINWADLVFVMEERHKKMIIEKFTGLPLNGKIIVLDIADRYRFMDEELILILKTTVAPYLDEPLGQ